MRVVGGEEFKYVPVGDGIDLEFSTAMSGGADMKTGILWGCGYGDTILRNYLVQFAIPAVPLLNFAVDDNNVFPPFFINCND